MKDIANKTGLGLATISKYLNGGSVREKNRLAIEKAIADEAVAKKRVETAEQNRLKAKKDAETKVINAKAEADANKILEKQMTNKILAQQWIKKWNGEVPKVSGDNKSMINIGDLIK
mgnify:CR=1 FL=1